MTTTSGPLVRELEFARTEQIADPFGFRFAPQEYLLRSASGGFESAWLSWDAELIADLEAARRPGRDPAVVQRVGERLRVFVTQLGWAEQVPAIVEASREGRGVLLSVRSAAAELYALPWELLTLKASGQHIGELPGVLLRYEWPTTTTTKEQPTPRDGAGRILLGWSAAGGAVPATPHLAAIQRACRAGFHDFSPARDVLAHASLSRLNATLLAAKKEGQPISVLHLLCHGGAVGSTFGLAFDGEEAGSDTVIADASRLRQLLAPHAGMVRLVVLMACDSGNAGALGNQLGSVAQALHRAGIAQVVASRYPLSVRGSIQVTESLYQGLLVGLDSLERTLLAVRAELAADATQLDWASVQLYARVSDGADTRPLVIRPYQGLASFGAAQRRFFFGREALTEKLWQHLRRLYDTDGGTRLLAVLGPSGSGKSSVACSGLLSELEQRPIPGPRPLRTVLFKPGEHPLRALADALWALPLEASDSQVLVLVDQLEEIYTLCSDREERDLFVELLLKAARNADRQVLVILTMRSDFLGEMLRHHPELNRVIVEQCMLVGGMSDDELRRAISEPARKVGHPIDDATVDLLLAQTQGSDGALPLLQFALSRIFEGILSGKQPVATLGEIGGVGGALAGKAQEIYSKLSNAQKATARRALVRLVKLGEGTRDTRRRRPVRELCGSKQNESDVLTVLRQFATENARLVTLSGDAAAPLAEFTHESLFDHWTEFRHWIDESRPEHRFHDRVAEAVRLWDENGRETGRLWRSPDLDLLRRYREEKADSLSPLQGKFLVAAERQQHREIMRTRLIAAGFLLAGVLSLIAALFYARKSEEIRQQLLSTYVETGRILLIEKNNPSEALLWLHRAYAQGSKHPMLRFLLATATRPLSSAHTMLIGHNDVVTNAMFSPDGQFIVTASRDKTARIWDSHNGNLLRTILHSASVKQANFSADNRFIVTLREHGPTNLQVWDGRSGELWGESISIPNSKESILGGFFSLSHDGRRLMTSTAGRAEIRELISGNLITTVYTDAQSLRTAEFSPDGHRIVTVDKHDTAKVWDLDTGKEIISLEKKELEILGLDIHITFSPDGRHILLNGIVWEADTGQRLFDLNGCCGSFSPDGRYIVLADKSKGRVWEAGSGRLVAELTGHTESINRISFSPDGRHIVSASYDRTARVWDAETYRPTELIKLYRRENHNYERAYISLNGRYLVKLKEVNGGYKGIIWDVVNEKLLGELKGHSKYVNSAEFSRNGLRIITASDDGTAHIWETETGNSVMELKGHAATVTSASFSQDDSKIVTTSNDGTTRIWNSDNGRILFTLHTGNTTSASFGPDNARIVIAADKGMIKIWDTKTSTFLAEFRSNFSEIATVSYSPDGRRILVIGMDETAQVWDASTYRLLTLLKKKTPIKTRLIHGMFSPDGNRIITTDSNQVALIWEVETGKPIAKLGDDDWDSIESAVFSSDGRDVFSVYSNGGMRIWDVGPEERTPEEIEALIRCRLLLKFEGDTIVTSRPEERVCPH